MSERKLASIQKITKLSPIKDADRIEVADILGWKVVVQKGLHKVNDLVFFFEIDSLLPEIPEFEFLRKSCYIKESQNGCGFRLRTIKLKKQVSQGMIMPIRELNCYLFSFGDPYDYRPVDVDLLEEGMDVTQDLCVKKYEKIIPAKLAGKVRGNFPSFIPKTDQERVQNFIGDFMKNYRDHVWETSLKLDGSSCTIYYNSSIGEFGVCSRNMNLTETEENSFWQVARKYDLEQKMANSDTFMYVPNPTTGIMEDFPKSYAIQGELMGPGVQGNRENLSELDLYVYDIWDIENQRYLDSKTRLEMTRVLGLKHVPVYETCSYGFDDSKGFLDHAEYAFDGKSLNHPHREGLVFKSLNDPNVSFKAISNKFLLEGGD